MTTQIVLASTAFGLATVTAAFDSGAFEPARTPDPGDHLQYRDA